MEYSLTLEPHEAGLIAFILNNELNRIELETPCELREPDSYEHRVKDLHRKIMKLTPNI
jgi:hypothetical protein